MKETLGLDDAARNGSAKANGKCMPESGHGEACVTCSSGLMRGELVVFVRFVVVMERLDRNGFSRRRRKIAISCRHGAGRGNCISLEVQREIG